MTNFDVAEQALKTSQESAGSAMSEHEKWMQSLEAKFLPQYLETNIKNIFNCR